MFLGLGTLKPASTFRHNWRAAASGKPTERLLTETHHDKRICSSSMRCALQMTSTIANQRKHSHEGVWMNSFHVNERSTGSTWKGTDVISVCHSAPPWHNRILGEIWEISVFGSLFFIFTLMLQYMAIVIQLNSKLSLNCSYHSQIWILFSQQHFFSHNNVFQITKLVKTTKFRSL